MEYFEQSNTVEDNDRQQEEPGIRACEPFPVKPLRFSGIFGVGWQLFRRNIAAVFLLSLTLVGVGAALLGLVSAPMMDVMMEIVEGGMSGTMNPDWMLDKSLELIGMVPLVLLLSLTMTFLIGPMYNGALYQELHDRAEGRIKSVKRLFQSIGAGLKKVYTTMLVMMLMMFCLSFVCSIIMSVSMMGSMFAGMAGGRTIESLLGGIIVMYVVVLAAVFVFSTFLLLMLPVNAAENKRAFHALTRSFKLAGKRFWRCLGILALLVLMELVVMCVGYIPGVALLASGNASFSTVYCVMLLGFTLLMCLYTPYQTAVITALYRDCAARVPDAAAAPALEEAAAVPVPEEEHKEGE